MGDRGLGRWQGGFVAMLDVETSAALLRLGRVRHYRRGSTIIRQGDHDTTVYVLLEGRMKVTLETIDGREVVLAVRRPGELLGYFEAIEPDADGAAASVVTLEPVECRVIAAEEFREFLMAHPVAVLTLLRRTIRNVRAADRRRVDSAVLDTGHRLARFLLECADDQGEADPPGNVLDMSLTQEELASLIASSRESVVRALASLRTRGLIETGRRQITIRDLEGLRSYAG